MDSRHVRQTLLAEVASLAILFATASRVDAGDGGQKFADHGVALIVPRGWWASGRQMSSGVEPVFRVTLSDRALHRTQQDSGPCYGGIARQIQPDGVVAILREAFGADFKPARFHLRSRRFVLPPRKLHEDNSCLGDHATLVIFRQAGRGFYLWIAAGAKAPAAKIAALLRALDAMSITGASTAK